MLKKQKNKKKVPVKAIALLIAMLCIIALFFSSIFFFDYSIGSSSNKSYEELEDWEKDNAKWAYYAQQAVNDANK